MTKGLRESLGMVSLSFMHLIEPVGTKGFAYSVTRLATDCSALISSRCLADSY